MTRPQQIARAVARATHADAENARMVARTARLRAKQWCVNGVTRESVSMTFRAPEHLAPAQGSGVPRADNSEA